MAEDAGTPPLWLLDACVLVPQLPREMLLGAAAAGLIRPCWSARLLGEWRLAAARRGGVEAERHAVARAGAMAEAFPSGTVAADPAAEARLATLVRDPADAHVAAAAAQAGARVITFNLRDFPARPLAAEGVAVSHPDAVLADLMVAAPAAMAAVTGAALAALDRPPGGRAAGRAALKRSGLPRCGKAWLAGGDRHGTVTG